MSYTIVCSSMFRSSASLIVGYSSKTEGGRITEADLAISSLTSNTKRRICDSATTCDTITINCGLPKEYSEHHYVASFSEQ